MSIFKLTEWNDVTGRWFCANVDDLGKGSSSWTHLLKITGKAPTEFVTSLVKDYKADSVSYLPEKNVLTYSWKNQTEMRVFKNEINRKARSMNYTIK